MKIEAQGELLNEFVGRPEPSEKLVDRAQALSSSYDSMELSPVFFYCEGANDRDWERVESADSILKESLIIGRIVGRTLVGITMDSPKIIKASIDYRRFEKSLKKEYPGSFTKPNPRPGFPRKPVLRKDAEQYASELIDFYQRKNDLLLA